MNGSSSCVVDVTEQLHQTTGVGAVQFPTKFGTRSSEIGLAFDVNKITNIVVPSDIVSDIGTVPGTRLEQFSETALLSSEPQATHSISGMTDVLAISNLLATIDPDIPKIKIDNVLNAASNRAETSLEAIVDQLHLLFVGSRNSIPTGDRERLYANIQAIFDQILTAEGALKPKFSGLSITDISLFSSSDLLALSQDTQRGLAFRYALKELSPFVVEGNDALYDANALSLDNFSDQYLTDRALFLATRIRMATADVSVEALSTAGNFQFIDVASALTLTTIKTGTPKQRFIFGTDTSEGREAFATSNVADHVFGGGGIDTVFGQGGNDYIEGNADDDMLHGEAGDDTLIGGDGDDELHGGDDNDTLYGDSDDPDNTTFSGADTLNGDTGNDELHGGKEGDTLDGGDDNDRLFGDQGNDELIGGTGTDTLEGGADDDTLYGGEKVNGNHVDDNTRDLLEGGAGNDTYYVGNGDIIDDGDRANQNARIDFNGIDVRGEFKQIAGEVYENEAKGLILKLAA